MSAEEFAERLLIGALAEVLAERQIVHPVIWEHATTTFHEAVPAQREQWFSYVAGNCEVEGDLLNPDRLVVAFKLSSDGLRKIAERQPLCKLLYRNASRESEVFLYNIVADELQQRKPKSMDACLDVVKASRIKYNASGGGKVVLVREDDQFHEIYGTTGVRIHRTDRYVLVFWYAAACLLGIDKPPVQRGVLQRVDKDTRLAAAEARRAESQTMARKRRMCETKVDKEEETKTFRVNAVKRFFMQMGLSGKVQQHMLVNYFAQEETPTGFHPAHGHLYKLQMLSNAGATNLLPGHLNEADQKTLLNVIPKGPLYTKAWCETPGLLGALYRRTITAMGLHTFTYMRGNPGTNSETRLCQAVDAARVHTMVLFMAELDELPTVIRQLVIAYL
ncbi:Hypothetical protein POVN_LOCUS315 [uncultured virus]|nr:Hypothetical protein POVN_LOCUS315 [uncultured virus]